MLNRTKPNMVCQRCATVMLPGSAVCSACCSPLVAAVPAAVAVATAPAPVAMAADAAVAQSDSVLSTWPFGGSDAEAAAQVAANAVAAGVRRQLQEFEDSTSSTHVLTGIPAQRTEVARQTAEVESSVPAYGPNPFLAAARMQQARDEAYSA
ncbi:MAG TPA: hypothetical protein VHC43_10885 [Mycobacteriales bacterium]|nr:hypothetical protein [Mycobacteriales bacterium]